MKIDKKLLDIIYEIEKIGTDTHRTCKGVFDKIAYVQF
jgi:hypothetical protein